MANALVVSKFKGTKIDTLEVDATLSETHSMTNTVTDHPVEEGMDITDHVRQNPDGLTLNCMVTNTPMGSDASPARQVEQNKQKWTVTIPDPSENSKRADEAFKKLRALRDEGTLCKVVTSKRTYTNMEITDVTVPVTSKNFNGLEFTAVFKLVRIVQTRSVRASLKNPQTNTKNSAGHKTTTDVTDRAPLKRIADQAVKSDTPILKGMGEVALSHDGEGLQSQ